MGNGIFVGNTAVNLGGAMYTSNSEPEFNNITDEEIRLSTSFLRDVAPEAGRMCNPAPAARSG